MIGHFVGCASMSTARATRRFEFQKRRQLLIRAHNETLSVIAMCIAIQIVRPLESIAETQPQLQPALLRLSATFFITHQAVAEAQDTLQVNSDSVRLKLENSSVRVLEGRLQPGGREKMHSQPPRTSSNFFENSRRVIP